MAVNYLQTVETLIRRRLHCLSVTLLQVSRLQWIKSYEVLVLGQVKGKWNKLDKSGMVFQQPWIYDDSYPSRLFQDMGNHTIRCVTIVPKYFLPDLN